MKKFFLLMVTVFFYSITFSQPLFTYGNSVVDKAEFLRAFNKNKTDATDKEKALREYLDLYTKFKLKVKAAKDLRLDTLPQLKSDLQNFRIQVDEAYMNNDNAINALIDEAIVHAQKDLQVLHFFVPADATTNPQDSVKAAKGALEIYNQLQAGTKEYEKLASDISAKISTVKFSDVGYITAFTIAYEFEKIIYDLKPGTASKPYHSKKGWHIFIVPDERINPGKWRVAQILLAFPPGEADSYFKMQQQKADSLYTLIKAGADFAELAKQYSNDKNTFLSGGELPEFTSGRYTDEFEKEVFKLSKDGEITSPFTTAYGFHIVKRLSLKPTPTDKTDNALRYEIKLKVQQDSRINASKELFNQSVLKQVSYKKNTAIKDAELFRYADSVVANPLAYETKKYPVARKLIYTFAKSKLTGADWLAFIRDYKTNPELYKGENNAALLQKFIVLKSLEYYKAHLEEYNPEFRFQMDEFREGNLLFEIMERKIWSAAANDASGLEKYYDKNKSHYLWNTSADVIIFSCGNKKAADNSLTELSGGKDWKKIAEESDNTVQADSGRYELSQIALTDATTPAIGKISPVTVNETDGTASFLKIVKLHTAGEQRSFEEARGLVINDYQTLLEEKWIEALKKKYPIKVNEAVFQTLLK
jgi:peptidyl-prolyl cis-trans isomerase SurA